MALERIGLGGVLTFDNRQAVQATGGARDALGRFVKGAEKVPPVMKIMGVSVAQAFNRIAAGTKKIGTGIKQMGTGLAQTALGFAPLTAVMGAGISSAAKFEKQMDAVSAITRAIPEDMERLTDKAKQMGIESVFSATQSAEAMEFMGRAGASTDEIISGLQGVTAAAAAESLDLATASDLVAQATKIMGREWDQASNTADILALTSAKTNTNMRALGEALKFGGQSAAAMGFTLEETSAAMGLMANAGLRGSIGGTALMNMFNKLNKPTGKATDLMKQWGIKLTDATGKMLPMARIVRDFKKPIDNIRDASKRAAITTELFGIRGQRAFQALSKAGPEAMATLLGSLMDASKGIGAAQEAANKRLDNFLGAFTLFKSSVESLSIGIFGPLLGTFQGTIKAITENLNSVLFALEDVRKVWNDLSGDITNLEALEEKHGRTAVQIAIGIQSAIETIKFAWDKVSAAVSAVAQRFSDTFGGDTIATITKWAILIGLAAGAAAPLILALVTVGFAISGIATALGGLIAVASGVLSILSGAAALVAGVLSGPVILAVLAVIGTFLLFRDKLALIWQGIQSALLPAFEMISEVWSEVFGEVLMTLQFAWSEIKAVFNELFSVFASDTQQAGIDWVVLGKTLVGIITTTIITIIKVFAFMVKVLALAATTLVKIFSVPFKILFQIASKMITGVLQIFQGDLLDGLATMAITMLDILLSPLRLWLRGILALVNLIPGASKLVPEGLISFAEKGFGTFEAPEKPQVRAEQDEAKGLLEDQTEGILEMKTAEKKRAGEPPKTELKLDLTDKRTVEIDNKLCIDGEETIIATARKKQEIQERAGFKATPWQRRVAVEQGAAPRGRGAA